MQLDKLLARDPRDLLSMGNVLGLSLSDDMPLPTILYHLLGAIAQKHKIDRFSVTGIVESTGKGDEYNRRGPEMGRLWVEIPNEDDYLEIRIPVRLIQDNSLRVGDIVEGTMFAPEDSRPFTLRSVDTINGKVAAVAKTRKTFSRLKTTFPERRIRLEREGAGKMSPVGRMIDIVAPLGFGQRALVVAPPRTGKTVLLSEIAKSVQANHPDADLMVLLIDERPEEVAFLRQSVDCPIYASTFDKSPERHVRLTELVIERAKRLVEHGRDVVIVMDSLTRLARAYNTIQPSSGKVLTGGVDAAALDKPKRVFGSARAFVDGGSLTIIATALVDTGSRADQVFFEELKGTGSSEIVLDRGLSNRGIYPAIDILASGTRMDEKFFSDPEKRVLDLLRNFVKNKTDGTEWLITQFKKGGTNADLIRFVDQSSKQTSARPPVTPINDRVRSGMGMR